MSIHKRPEITEELIDFIRRFIAINPDTGRSRLSVMLCEIWGWRYSTDRTKDMSCRDILNALDKAGKITLPPPKSAVHRPGDSKGVKHLAHDETQITVKLENYNHCTWKWCLTMLRWNDSSHSSTSTIISALTITSARVCHI
jgi:hypothetical protein